MTIFDQNQFMTCYLIFNFKPTSFFILSKNNRYFYLTEISLFNFFMRTFSVIETEEISKKVFRVSLKFVSFEFKFYLLRLLRDHFCRQIFFRSQSVHAVEGNHHRFQILQFRIIDGDRIENLLQNLLWLKKYSTIKKFYSARKLFQSL